MGYQILPVDEFVPEKYKARFLRFLAKHWDEICHSVVLQYAAQGRSVMTIAMGEQGITLIGLSQKQAVAFFDNCILEGENLGKDSLRVMHKVLEYVQTYDPAKEMVLWFSFSEEDEFYCKVEMKLGSELGNPDLN